MWKIPILPRIKVFFWQLCNDALPTRYNLNKRLGGMEEECPLCCGRTETALHVFRDCGWIQEVWEGVGVDVDDEMGTREMREWVEWVMRRVSLEEFGLFMISCWALWGSRNKLLFEGRQWNVGNVVRRVVELQAEVQAVEGAEVRTDRGSAETVAAVREVLGWKKPGVGWVKINVDAGVVDGEGMGLGGVCRGETGDVVWGFCWQRVGVREVRMMEAEAILMGLREAKERGYPEVIMEGDNQSVIEDLQKMETRA